MEVEEISGKLMEVEENLEGSLSSHKRVTSSESDQPSGKWQEQLKIRPGFNKTTDICVHHVRL